ncbi:MAG: hypothetical protein NTY38_19950, partial [Acidobacteria bacterium]|nr:hypothetical protein [Acidobacteriota bacterium]
VSEGGLQPHTGNLRIEDAELLSDWGALVRRYRRMPTRSGYRREGRFSPGVFESRFGPWSSIPTHFRAHAESDPAWADVLPLLPVQAVPEKPRPNELPTEARPNPSSRHGKLDDRPVYGNPLDFRGLRHEPVNEQGVVFLFGMVARELGYMVEAVQAGFPDCEAKRQVARDKWQRVRIEFEFESRNFLDHGHQLSGCDVIVCWRHNWADCPLEVVVLSTVIRTLASAE